MKNIFKKLLFIFILLTISIASISFANNETTNYDNEVVPISMDGGTPVDNTSSLDIAPPNHENYFYAGTDDVYLSIPVEGDVFIISGGTVNIDTTVTGNAFICAPSIIISENATINASMFTVTNSLNIVGSIGVNVYNVSDDFTLDGTIKNDLFSTSNKTNLNGSIYNCANISAENIIISEDANIEENLNYSSKETINIPNNVVKGNINYSLIDTKQDNSFDLKDFIFSVISFMIFVIVIFIISKWLNCKFVNKYPDFVKNLPKSLLYGLLGLIVTPIVCIFLLILGITINLSLVLMAIYFILLFIASSIVIIILAKLMSNKLHTKFEKANDTLLSILSIAVLSLVYKILQLIPTFGIIVTFAFVIVGIGILIKSIIPTKEQKKS